MGRRLSEFSMRILPGDEYALMMLLDHDMFEDEDEIIVCGRAWTCTFLWCQYSDPSPFQIVRHYFGLLWYVSLLKSQPLKMEKER